MKWLNKILKWLNIGGGCPFKSCGASNYFMCHCGKTSISQPSPPTPPTAEETTRDAIAAQQESIPAQFELQREFGPRFTQLELESLQQFGAPFSQALLDIQKQVGVPAAENILEEQRVLSPELRPAQERLVEFLGEDNLLTPEEEREIIQSSRQASQSRGLAETGFSAREELRNLTDIRRRLRDQKINLALATTGRQTLPTTSGAGVAPQSFGPGQIAQSVTPSQIFGLTSNNFATQGSIFNTQSQAAANQPGSPFGQIAGGLVGAATGGFGGGFGSGLANSLF